MAKVNTYVQSFNTGVQDKTALTRVDLERMRLAAEIQTNLMCKATGPGFMRPGLEYITSSASGLEVRLKEFVFGATDAALFEFSNQSLRVVLNDLVITRMAVSSTVTNGDFSSATGWNLTGLNGGLASISGGLLTMNAKNVDATAKCGRLVTTASPGVEHALRIVVTHGPVNFRCGSTTGGDEYISETTLWTGEHSLAFTPTGSYYVQLSTADIINKTVDSIQIEAAGVMTLPTPWTTADLPNIRITQSADVCFVACTGYRQRRIERRASRSWSVAYYQSDDGPFQAVPERAIRMLPDVLNGNGTISSSEPYFKQSHVGAMFRIDHTGQYTRNILASSDSHTDTIRVTGIGSDRAFVYAISGTWVGTITLQRSYDSEDAGFHDVQTFTANAAASYTDTDDNSIYWYRFAFKDGQYTSGEATITLGYDGGGGFGICRTTSYISTQQMNMEVLTPFKKTGYTKNWRAGRWSDAEGWPSAVSLADGRLWWFGADQFDGSVSDAFASFDEEVEGDSGPISRSIATGGVNATQWALSLQRLLAGTEGAVSTIKSSSLDEPLTPTNLSVKDSSTTGVAAIDPIKIDARGIFVERSDTALMELTFDGSASDYVASQISKLTTDIFSSGVKAMAVQRRPDTRIWIVLEDGSAICALYEPDQQVLAFVPLETDGSFESVAVLPSTVQDRVYFSVQRQPGTDVVRYIEKMAMDSEIKPGALCKTVDAFKTGVNSPASTAINAGMHLVGASVVVWADGAPLETSLGVPATFTVNGSGNITVPSAVTNWVVGIPYRARFKSARLAYGAQGGTALLQKKTVDSLGIIMTDFVRAGIKYGHAFDDPYRGLFPLPQMADGKIQPAIVLSDIRDEESFTFPGEWSTDSRLCMEINSPYTAQLLGLVIQVNTNEK